MTLANDIKAYVNDNQSIIQVMQPYDRSYHSFTTTTTTLLLLP